MGANILFAFLLAWMWFCFLVLAVAVCLQVFADDATPNLKEIFVGRCLDLENIRGVSDPDCFTLWDKFYASFSNVSDADIDYSDFFNFANFTTPPNKSLFWSGSIDVVWRLSDNGVHYFSLEDTIAGHAANGLVWCGLTPSLTPHTTCPYPSTAKSYFWRNASHYFAQQATGSISILMQPHAFNRVAYTNTSLLSQIELPSLRPTAVKIVNLLVITHPDSPQEKCGSGSLVALQRDLHSYGFVSSCQDDPQSVKHLLCADGKLTAHCLFASQNAERYEVGLQDWELTLIVVMSVVGGMIAMWLVMYLPTKLKRARCYIPATTK